MKKKYEIINPSDKCFITGEHSTVCVATIYLGQAMYGLEDVETGESAMPILGFGGAKGMDSWAVDTFGVLFNELVDKEMLTPLKLAEAFESVTYAGERSSLNNIQKRAQQYAAGLRAKVAAGAEQQEQAQCLS